MKTHTDKCTRNSQTSEKHMLEEKILVKDNEAKNSPLSKKCCHGYGVRARYLEFQQRKQFERLLGIVTPRDRYTTKCSKLLLRKQDNDPKTATCSTSLHLRSKVTKEEEFC